MRQIEDIIAEVEAKQSADKHLVERSDGWHIRFMTPDGEPLEELRAFPSKEKAIGALAAIFRAMMETEHGPAGLSNRVVN